MSSVPTLLAGANQNEEQNRKDTLRVREAILTAAEPHWQTSWRERVSKFAEQVQVDRRDIFGNESPQYHIHFSNVPHLAYFICNSSAPTWTFLGSGSRVVDGKITRRDARNLLGLGHIHDCEAHQCPISYSYQECKNDSLDDLPMNLWYTILLRIHKLFYNTAHADCHRLYKNSIYVPLQHDPRLLYRTATYDAKGRFAKWVLAATDKWYQRVDPVCIGGRPNWFGYKGDFVKKLYAGFQSTMLDALFPYSTIKREVARQVVEQMTPYFKDKKCFQIGNQSMLQWSYKQGSGDDAPYPTLNTKLVYRYPTINQTWITSDKSEKLKVPQISANSYLTDIELGELLAWMDTCSQDMLNVSDFFKSPEELDKENQSKQSNSLEFPSLDDHFPDHTNPLTFRGRLAQTVFPKAFVFYHAILAEIAESADDDDDEYPSSPGSSNCSKSEILKRLRFLKPVAKIIHDYLPFPTTTPRAKSAMQRVSFTQFETVSN